MSEFKTTTEALQSSSGYLTLLLLARGTPRRFIGSEEEGFTEARHGTPLYEKAELEEALFDTDGKPMSQEQIIALFKEQYPGWWEWLESKGEVL